MSRLLELAERVERAEGPDREMDALIWCALNGKRFKGWHDVYGANSGRLTQVEFTEPPRRTRFVTDDRRHKHALPYTASIDAAMTLVPVDDDPIDILETAIDTARAEQDGVFYLPLHIVAAALRARAAQDRQP